MGVQAGMLDQLSFAETGAATPPELKLTRRQRFALELITHTPLSSENLGAALHEYRMKEGGKGHDARRPCQFCRAEGAHMGDALRKKKLVRFARNLAVWYSEDKGRPKTARELATTDIPF